MKTRAIAALVLCALVSSCKESVAPTLRGGYGLIEENGDPVPSDPFAPDGCCVTLGGTIGFVGNTYNLEMRYQNKNNGTLFSNTEQGTYVRSGNTLSFTRAGGGGIGFPFLLAPGSISSDERFVTLLYGDEGPGSNQIQATFERLLEALSND